MPVLGESIHFVNYIEPIIGQDQAAVVTRVNVDDGTVNLVYFSADPADPENPPMLTEFKFRVPYDSTTLKPRTWHYASDHGI
jgi:hypothetical protein